MADAAVLHPVECHRQRVANSKAATAIRHPIRQVDVLEVALREAANIIKLSVVVFRKDPEQIVGDEDGIIITHDEPPYVLQPQLKCLGDDPGDTDGGAAPLAVAVREAGGFAGDFDGGEAVIVGAVFQGLVDPDDAAHLVGLPPELYVLLPLLPEPGRGGNAEDDVMELSFSGGRVGGSECRVGGGGGGGVGEWGRRAKVVGRGNEFEGVEDVGEGEEYDEADHELVGVARRRRRRVFAHIA